MVRFSSTSSRSPRGSSGKRLHLKWLVSGGVIAVVILLLRRTQHQMDAAVPKLLVEEDAPLQQETRKTQEETAKTSPGALAAASTKKQYYDESKILQFTENLVQAPQTVVTAYFRIRSKHSSDNYKNWMKNMLSLQDPMVIFLSPALIPEIQQLRQHALNRTVIIPMELQDVPMAQQYNVSFWQWQLDIDKEKRIHRSYEVFWIWLSKSWWVTQAIQHNFFSSQIFVWSDMGCFRDRRYNHKQMVLHPQQVPRHSMLFLAHHATIPPPTPIFNNKYDKEMKKHFYTSGSMMAGHADTFTKFHNHFLDTIAEFLDRDMFIGEDQLVIQSTCLVHATESLCAYVSNNQVNDNHYFGLRYILHHGGNYTLWFPPSYTGQQQQY